ncbi:hypothetical protein C5E46_32215 [Nocardia nova]|nr:hypothetical protein C5E46_32215 [Nocardia nova]
MRRGGAVGGRQIGSGVQQRVQGVRRFRLTWPLVWRPLHDALMEDSIDLAETTLVPGSAPRNHHNRAARFPRGRIHRDQVRKSRIRL